MAGFCFAEDFHENMSEAMHNGFSTNIPCAECGKLEYFEDIFSNQFGDRDVDKYWGIMEVTTAGQVNHISRNLISTAIILLSCAMTLAANFLLELYLTTKKRA